MHSANPSAIFGPVIVGVVSNAVFAILLWLGQSIYTRTARRNPIYRRRRLVGMLILWGFCNVVVFFFISSAWPSFFVLSLIIASIVILNELNQFWKVGLVGADQQVKSGIGYVAALGMCKSSLDFLGIGAAKLIEHQKDFREAIDRCSRSDKPVRLLLSRPDVGDLQRIARMAGQDPEAYQRKVSESLRFIARLRNQEQRNISVRLYHDLPAFRLMFINEAICLMSYYVLGKGDGSDLPQLHIVKTAEARDVDSLYYGFAAYFGKIWETSDEWNFQDYLTE